MTPFTLHTFRLLSIFFFLFPASFSKDPLSWLVDKTLNFILPVDADPINAEIAREARMNVANLIERYGYRVENHTVQTKDGYLLGLHRIPEDKNGRSSTEQYPLLLQHGLFCCSGNFVDNGEDSLAFFLANAGFDVWLGNFRGNLYSRKHMTLSPSDDKFWDFTIDDHAAFDLPSMIDYIRERTGIDEIILVAHSLGTSVAFATLASIPEYNEKIKGVLALGPVGSLRYIPSFSRRAAEGRRVLESAVNVLGVNEFIPHRQLVEEFLIHACPASNPVICFAIMSADAGYESVVVNSTRVPVYLNHCNAGTGVKVLIHLGQIFESINMTHFDYGSTKNFLVYGQEFPPNYVLSNIRSPIALVYAANDALADPMDVQILSRQLKSVLIKELFPYVSASHYSFFWLTNATQVFYNRFYQILRMLIDN